MRRPILPVVLVSVLVFCLASPNEPATAGTDSEDPIEAVWESGGIDTSGWQQLPGSDGMWGQPPVPAAGNDPYVYKYETACLAGDNAIYPACAAALP
uniref:hypothetical protein n=1 Tax=Specibacter cremeus TaxID=1629051 RepID=UPI00197BC27D